MMELHLIKLLQVHLVPLNYGYTTLEVESYNNTTSSYEKNIRYFWDGGIMSNTPLTSVVQLPPSVLAQKKGVQTYSSKVKYRHNKCSSR